MDAKTLLEQREKEFKELEEEIKKRNAGIEQVEKNILVEKEKILKMRIRLTSLDKSIEDIKLILQ